MNKPYIKITHDYLGNLREKESNDSSMYILGSFLTDDVGFSSLKWKKLLLDDINVGGGNFSSIYHEKDGKFRIQESWEDPGKGPYILLSKKEFVHVLDEWAKVYKEDTKEILITREEDGSIKFEVKK